MTVDGNEIITQPVSEPSRAEERITQLSDKVKEEATARAAAEERAATAERKAAFSEGYADMVATNPAAKEFKADIEAKVISGYSVEDATYAVLGKAGKLGGRTPDPVMPAGGSAVVTPPQTGSKTVAEMTQSERRAQLEKDITWQ